MKRSIIELLRGALEASRLELSEFGRLHPTTYENALPYPKNEKEVTPFIKERVKLHHDTWITNPIKEALELLGIDDV